MRSEYEFHRVRELLAAGLSSRTIEALTGVPSSTVRYWSRGRGRGARRRSGLGDAWRPGDHATYCYVLGLYLGDGHIVRKGRSAFIRIFLDAGHPVVVAEARRALEVLWPGRHVGCHEPADRRIAILQMSDGDLPFAFPQHGPGRKHKRKIELVDWQLELTQQHPRELIRGLIHSDGCRTVNRFKVKLPSGRVGEYAYPRYFFSNLSEDIRRIFCEHCELLGIRWTQSNSRNISISHRDSVALLDEFVGPKR